MSRRALLPLVSAATATALMLLLGGTASSYGPVSTSTWVVSGGLDGGVVASVAVSGSTAYVGGNFKWVGPPTGSFVGLDSSGALVSPWPAVGGEVYAAVSDGADGFYIGGSFASIGTRHADNIAHIKGDGTLDTDFAGGTDGTVLALALSGTTVYAGGTFSNAHDAGAPVTRASLAAFDRTTGAVVTGFNPGVSGLDGSVQALRFSGTRLYVGGSFATLGGVERLNLGAVNEAGVFTDWNPMVNDVVFALAVGGSGTVYAGGLFTTVNAGNVPRNRAAAFDSNGTVTAWNPNPSSAVYALEVSGPIVYAGGTFTKIGSQTTQLDRRALAALDATTGEASGWNPNVIGAVHQLAVPDANTVYAAGAFATVGGGTARDNVAAFNTTDGVATGFWSVVGGDVWAIAVSGTTVGVGGVFRSAGAGGSLTAPLPRSNLAAIDLTSPTGAATSWAPRANGNVQVLAAAGGVIYAGGAFTTINSVSRPRLAAFLPTGADPLTPWNPGVHNGQVLALTVVGSAVYAGGTFSGLSVSTPPVARNRAAAFQAHGVGNGFGDLINNWDPNMNAPVFALDSIGNTIYLGGSFTRMRDPGGFARNGLAASIATGPGGPTNWDPNVNGFVLALAHSGSTVYAGGEFTTVNGSTARTSAAAFSTSGNGPATAWSPQPVAPPGQQLEIHSLAASESIVYMSGVFRSVGGHDSPSVAALSPSTGAPLTSWHPAANSTVSALALAPQGLVLGGKFTALGYPLPDTPFLADEPAATYRGGFGLVRALVDAPAVTVTPGDSSANVSFTAPAYNGGAAITGYTLTVTPGPIVMNDVTSPVDVPGLTNGTAYTFSVTATTSAGTGAAGVASTTPHTVPGAPTGVTAVAGENTVTISFSPPASNGGDPITVYTVTASPGGNTASGAGSPIVMTGLTNDTTYTFTVTARNSAGDGPPSAPSDPVTARSAGRPHPNPPDPASPRPPVPPLPPVEPRPPLPTP